MTLVSRNVFLRSDEHFEHRNICRYTDRPWANWDEENVGADNRAMQDMGDAFVTFHNEVVKPNDVVIFGGDVVSGDVVLSLHRWVASMNGEKILVVGNHETSSSAYREVFSRVVTRLDMHQVLPVSILPQRVIVNHFPYEPGTGPRKISGPDPYAAFRPPREPGQWLLHGHTHDHRIFTGDHQINIGIDADYTKHGIKQYRPIPFDLIDALIIATESDERTHL